MTDWLTHFRLKADPFDPLAASLSPYLGEPYRSTVLRLEQALERRRGWIHVIGDPGVGKTTVVQAVVRDFDAYASVSVSACSNLSERVLSELLVGEHAPPGGSTAAARRGMLLSVVKAARISGRPIIVFVDDVDHAHVKDLESLRLALNVDPAVAEIVQVVLAGRERFAGALQGRAARGVASRIAVRIALPRMTNERVGDFVTGCLKAAGCKRPKEIVTPDALAVIAACGDGLAGRCAMLARESLRRAAAAKADCVDPVMVREAVQMIGVVTRSSKRDVLHLLHGRASRYALLVSTAVAGTFILLPLLRAGRLDEADRVAAATKRTAVTKPSTQPAVATVSAIAVDEPQSARQGTARVGDEAALGAHAADATRRAVPEPPSKKLPIVIPLDKERPLRESASRDAAASDTPSKSAAIDKPTKGASSGTPSKVASTTKPVRNAPAIDLHPGSKSKAVPAGGSQSIAPVSAKTAPPASPQAAPAMPDEAPFVGPTAPRDLVRLASARKSSDDDADQPILAPDPAEPASQTDVMPGFSSALSLQVGAYTSRARAESVRTKLSKHFVGVYLEEGKSGSRPVFRVRVGRFVDGDEMKTVESRLAAAGYSWYRAPVP